MLGASARPHSLGLTQGALQLLSSVGGGESCGASLNVSVGQEIVAQEERTPCINLLTQREQDANLLGG